MEYSEVADAIAPTGMIARGGFRPDGDDEVPAHSTGAPVRTVVVIGNVGGEMWPRFEGERTAGPDPLDRWTRSVLGPIAASFGADYVHPSDEPFRPFQRWAQRADDVWPSPIGLLVHPDYGLWHAYRGALLFDVDVGGVPEVGGRVSPCTGCIDRPCLGTCPVDAFTGDGYDADACRGHIRGEGPPDCLHDGCFARRACPVAAPNYGPSQMLFHMRAFLGAPSS